MTAHGGEMPAGGRVVSPLTDDVDWVVSARNRLVADIHRRLERFAVRTEQ